MKTHKDLDVWNNAMGLVTEIYKVTKSFPKEELYSLTSQIRRSAVSVPSNIAEGAGRKHDKEFAQFLFVARGSLSELETQIIIAKNLGYLEYDLCGNLIEKMNIIRRQIVGLIKYLGNKT